LKQSIEDWGIIDLVWFAVYRDEAGRILSGRHCMAAAQELGIRWPEALIHVPDDAAALHIALITNEHTGWSKRDKRKMEPWVKRCGAAGMQEGAVKHR
jgi:hypothetical protein